jgi:hypothetical protein
MKFAFLGGYAELDLAAQAMVAIHWVPLCEAGRR